MVISHSHVSFPGLNYDPVRGLRLKSCQNPALFQWILSQALPGPSMGTPKWTHEGSGRVSKKEPIAWKKIRWSSIGIRMNWISNEYRKNHHISTWSFPTSNFPNVPTFIASFTPWENSSLPSQPVPRCAKLLRWALQGFPASSGSSRWHRLAKAIFHWKTWGKPWGFKHGFTMKIRGFHQQECEDQNCFFEIWGKLMVWFAKPFGSIWYSIYLLDPIGVVKAPFISWKGTSSIWIHQG